MYGHRIRTKGFRIAGDWGLTTTVSLAISVTFHGQLLGRDDRLVNLL